MQSLNERIAESRPQVLESAVRSGSEMPFIIIEGYRLGFYSNERNEPPHVHVLRGGHEAKLWLKPVQLVHNYGYNHRELSKVMALVQQHEARLLEMWYEHFR
jgi:hypothetical protein